MFSRFNRIYAEFGWVALAKVIVLLVALIVMSVLGLVGLGNAIIPVVAVFGLILGWLMRRLIVEWADHMYWGTRVGMFVYGVALLLGDKVFGLSRDIQFAIIVATTAIMFSIQFWMFSDPAIVNTERES